MTWLTIFLVLISPIAAALIVAAADRIAFGQKLFNSPAKCDHCQEEIGTIDLLPLVGWLIQMGKCRHCGKAISLSYSAGEIAVIAVTVVPLLFTLPILVHIIAILLGWILVFFAIVDVHSGNRIREYCLPVIIVGWIMTWFQQPDELLKHVLAAVLAFCFFWTVDKMWTRFRERKAASNGDMFFAAMIGAWIGVEALIATIFLGLFLSSFIGLAQLAYQKQSRSKLKAKKPIQTPLVPGLAISFFAIWLLMQNNLHSAAQVVGI